MGGDLKEAIYGEQRRAIAELIGRGLTDGAISRQLGCERKTVWRWRKRLGVSPKPAPDFPVHDDVADAKARLLSVFTTGAFDPAEFAKARARLSHLVQQHHPRESRHPLQFERHDQ